MIGDFPIYSDYHHFSDWGSRYLSGKMLAPVLTCVGAAAWMLDFAAEAGIQKSHPCRAAL